MSKIKLPDLKTICDKVCTETSKDQKEGCRECSVCQHVVEENNNQWKELVLPMLENHLGCLVILEDKYKYTEWQKDVNKLEELIKQIG